jgi:hypothetical protein
VGLASRRVQRRWFVVDQEKGPAEAGPFLDALITPISMDYNIAVAVFQEFSNEGRCKAAKAKLEGSLKEAGGKLRSGLEDLKSMGKADPAQIIVAYNVECLPK